MERPDETEERPVCLRCGECGKTLCVQPSDHRDPAVLQLLRLVAIHLQAHRTENFSRPLR